MYHAALSIPHTRHMCMYIYTHPAPLDTVFHIHTYAAGAMQGAGVGTSLEMDPATGAVNVGQVNINVSV